MQDMFHLAYTFPLDVEGGERTTVSLRRLVSVSCRNFRVSTVPAELTPNYCWKPQLRLSRDEPRPTHVPVTEPSSRRDGRFKTYSGSGAAPVREQAGLKSRANCEAANQPTASFTRSNPELSAVFGESVKPAPWRQPTHREATHGYVLSPVSAPG